MVDEIGLVEDSVLDNTSFNKSRGSLHTVLYVRLYLFRGCRGAFFSKARAAGKVKPALPLGQRLG